MAGLPVYKNCRLCGVDAALRLSHIFPKFYWDWMKRTGGRFFRDPRRPNIRLQDGVKFPMLCAQCEALFSRVESRFATHIFEPLVANPSTSVAYGAYAFRTLVSILWRNLAVDLDARNCPGNWRDARIEVEKDWRTYLLDDEMDQPKFARLHMIVTDVATGTSPQENVYMTRLADATCMWTDDRLLAYYAKFAKFLVFAEIAPFVSEGWSGTLLACESGTFEPGGVRVADGSTLNFLRERARIFEDARRLGLSAMTTKQRQKVVAEWDKNWDRLSRSEMGRALAADFAWNDSIPKVGRNEQCPCGSGRKYKRCHGA